MHYNTSCNYFSNTPFTFLIFHRPHHSSPPPLFSSFHHQYCPYHSPFSLLPVLPSPTPCFVFFLRLPHFPHLVLNSLLSIRYTFFNSPCSRYHLRCRSPENLLCCLAQMYWFLQRTCPFINSPPPIQPLPFLTPCFFLPVPNLLQVL